MKTKTLDNSTVAAMPGGITVSRKKFAEYYGTNEADRWFYRCCSHLPWFARYMPIIGARTLHWTQVREHLEYGCLNPAVVVDSKSGLIAVFTSLTARGEKPTPVVKVVHERLGMIDNAPTTNGSKFAAASVYARTKESWAQGRWSDFFPIVVDCLADDYRRCEHAVARIKPLAWSALEMALQQLAGESRKGLFHVNVPDDLVWNAF
jgi:hypothetical protein